MMQARSGAAGLALLLIVVSGSAFAASSNPTVTRSTMPQICPTCPVLPVTGDAADVCVRAHSGPNFTGDSWLFCPASAGVPNPASSSFAGRIDSLQIPEGQSIQLCSKPDGNQHCRRYFEDTTSIRNSALTYYESAEVLPFNAGRFRMAFASDPQYDFCESLQFCQLNAGTSWQANKWHSNSLKRLVSDEPDVVGVVINGDLTNVASDEELEFFRINYEHRGLNLYLGLGNHDYDNYYTSHCDLAVKHSCAAKILDWTAARIYTIPGMSGTRPVRRFDYEISEGTEGINSLTTKRGSWGYFFDIGNYRFIQLHNYPAYELNFRTVYFNGLTDYNLVKALDWLEDVLDNTPAGRNVILNMHAMLAASFSATGNPDAGSREDLSDDNELVRSTSSAADFATFSGLVARFPAVRAIFAGHLHSRVGEWEMREAPSRRDTSASGVTITTITGSAGYYRMAAGSRQINVTDANGATRSVPVLFNGGGEYNHYLLVQFEDSSLSYEVVDSTGSGVARGFDTNGNQLRGTVSW